MIGYLIAVICSLIVGVSITYIVCRFLPQEEIRQLNEARLREEEQYLYQLKREQDEARYEIDKLWEERSNIFAHIVEMRTEAEQTAQAFYDKEMELAQERLDRALERAAAKYQEDEEACKEEYLRAIQEFAIEFQQSIANQKMEFVELQVTLTDLKDKVATAVEAAKREEEKRTKKDFYRLILSETDLQEIQYLRQVEPFLRDKEALNKVIWKVYYEKPYTDLVGRVIGSSVKTGIYKITNLENQMCYVGQAVNIAERWRQHIKRGIGAEAPTRNKLYPAMLSIGAHNFTFEIIEECDRNLLNEREDYWQDYFKAKEFGYSIK